jgi:hypothetical protein
VQIFHGATVNIQTGPSFAFAKTSYSGNLQQILTIGDQQIFLPHTHLKRQRQVIPVRKNLDSTVQH